MAVLTDITSDIEKENVAEELQKVQHENAVISHELKTPLEVINQESSSLSGSMQKFDKESKRSVNAIKIASIFMSNFV
eukprot:CAMPEP_0116886966 /NCGR_PEP_ID=MMETSP0463-20121206/21011_1 /TAXON_ID=181622 /ORGANISM="Strombidinopsis sp, Strain SopsisLIS2011" /LENGTH=77 /DNA_ID=CAMNT_0004548305 /DNA_START=371 /DNA_END=604 /DNA_ORIENTATION=+